MKIAIVYASSHHGNTRKVVEAIAEAYAEDVSNAVDLYNVADGRADLRGYDMIGFASGIYYGKLDERIMEYAEEYLPVLKKVFVIETYGGMPKPHILDEFIELRECRNMGTFACKGYDTFGPFKLMGGIAKGHPEDRKSVV